MVLNREWVVWMWAWEGLENNSARELWGIGADNAGGICKNNIISFKCRWNRTTVQK